MPAHHPSPLLLPWEAPPAVPSSAPFPLLSSHASHPAPWPDRGNALGEGGSQEFLKQSPDGIPKAEMTCFWRLGCPASLVMMGELTTSNSLGEKGTDFGVRQMQAQN